MALKKQFYTLPMASGVDTKTDPRHLSGKLQKLENAVFTTPGKLSKRPGYTKTTYTPSTRGTASDVITAGKGLLPFQDRTVALLSNRTGATRKKQTDNDHLYEVTEELSKAKSKMEMDAVSTRIIPVTRPTLGVRYPDLAVIGDLMCVVHQEGTGASSVCYLDILDMHTGGFVADHLAFSYAGAVLNRPKVFACATYFVVLLSDDTNGKIYWGRQLSTSIPSAAPTLTAVITDYNSTYPLWDACVLTNTASGALGIMYRTTKATTQRTDFAIASATTGAVSSHHYIDAGPQRAVAIEEVRDYEQVSATYYPAVAYDDDQGDGGFDLYVKLYNTAHSAVVWTKKVNVTELNDDDGSLIGLALGSQSKQGAHVEGYLFLAYDRDGNVATYTNLVLDDLTIAIEAGMYSKTTIDFLAFADGDIDATAGFPVRGIASKPFYDAETARIILTTLDPYTLGSTYFLENVNQQYCGVTAPILMRRSHGCHGFLTLYCDNSLTKVISYGGKWYAALVRLEHLTDLQKVTKSVVLAEVTTAPAIPFQRGLIDGQALLASGHLREYDGQLATEPNFLAPPIIYHSAHDDGTGVSGLVAPGAYQYCAIYEWTDKLGQIDRSAPSNIFAVTVAATHAANYVDVKVTGSLAYDRNATGVKVVLFRTEKNGEVFYRTKDADSAGTEETHTIRDLSSDATLLNRELLYTTGGAFENDAPPPSDTMIVRRDRVILVSNDDRREVWPSQVKTQGLAVSFSEDLVKRITVNDEIVALGELDDKIVIFLEDRIRYFYGEGLDNTGGGSVFSADYEVPSDVGCSERNSVVKTPAGLMFKSKKGIYLLDHNLSATYIGAPVEDWNTYTVLRAAVHTSKHQALFALSNGEVLVFDFLVGQWGVWTGHTNLVDLEVVNDKVLWLDSAGACWLQNLTTYLDNATGYSLKLRTEWIKVAGIAGVQRVWRIYLEGEYVAAHQLTVVLYYDFDETTPGEVFTITPTAGVERLRITPARQRCTALMVEVYEVSTSGYDSMTLSAIVLEVGVEERGAKLRAEKTF